MLLDFSLNGMQSFSRETLDYPVHKVPSAHLDPKELAKMDFPVMMSLHFGFYIYFDAVGPFD